MNKLSKYLKNPKGVAIALLLVCGTAVISYASYKVVTATSSKGDINDVEISDEKSSNDDRTVFTKLDAPFSYEFTTLKSGMTFSKMDIPASYEATVNNARHITLQVPDDDKHLSGATFQILYNFATVGSTINLDYEGEDTTATDPHGFHDLFAWELPYLTYKIGGQDYTLRTQELPDEAISGYKFTRTDNVYCEVCNNVKAKNYAGQYNAKNYSQVTYYYTLDKIPAVISTVVPRERVNDAKTLMEYMISSTTYMPSKINSKKSYDLKNCTVTLPDEMTLAKGSDNNVLYVAQDKTFNGTAGMAVGTFTVDTTETDAVTTDTMDSVYAPQIASQIAFNASGTHEITTSQTSVVEGSGIMLGGKKTKHYQNSMSMVTPYAGIESPYAGTFLGDPAIYYMDTLVAKDGDKQRILAVYYAPTQYKDAQKILKMAAASIEFR